MAAKRRPKKAPPEPQTFDVTEECVVPITRVYRVKACSEEEAKKTYRQDGTVCDSHLQFNAPRDIKLSVKKV